MVCRVKTSKESKMSVPQFKEFLKPILLPSEPHNLDYWKYRCKNFLQNYLFCLDRTLGITDNIGVLMMTNTFDLRSKCPRIVFPTTEHQV